MGFWRAIKNLTKKERILWIGSIFVILVSYFFGGGFDIPVIIGTFLGTTSIIFISKGDVHGNILMVGFCLLYAWTSFHSRYYGEMITYVGMTLPITVLSIVTWLRHPYEEAQVKVRHLGKVGWILTLVSSVLVTVLFYFILAYFHTKNLPVSTISITASFLAATLMMLRSPWYAAGYAANDIIVCVLWTMESFQDTTAIPMAVNFGIFLFNDTYGFYNWRRMERKQK